MKCKGLGGGLKGLKGLPRMNFESGLIDWHHQLYKGALFVGGPCPISFGGPFCWVLTNPIIRRIDTKPAVHNTPSRFIIDNNPGTGIHFRIPQGSVRATIE